MHTRFLTVLAVSAFVLTLLFTVSAGAQDESTGATATLGGGGGEQAQQSQNQQVQARQLSTLAVEPQAQGCQGQKREFTVGPKSNETDRDFQIEGDKFRVVYDVEFTDGTNSNNEFTLSISNGSEFLRSRSTGDNHEEFVVSEGSGDFTLEARLKPQDNGTYTITVYDCKNAESSNNNDGGGGNDDGGNNDDTTDGGVTPTQADTTDGTTTDGATTDGTTTGTGTSDPTAELTTADNAGDSANREGSFRCESFLHVVRDEDGALRRQYNDDELVVQRFERCLEADVLANTIPNRLLPDTGGSSLPFGGGALLLATGAALALRMIRR